MSFVPLPTRPRFNIHNAKQSNLSLFFDRAFNGYETNCTSFIKANSQAQPPVEDGKKKFLDDFAASYTRNPKAKVWLEQHNDRRDQALQAAHAKSLDWTSKTPIVLGMGLAHPGETGFLFDRLTGVPYLPASSVKGLARSAATHVCRGELEHKEVEPGFWAENLERLFGPADVALSSRKGEAVFHDAFPRTVPELRGDILNPHYPADTLPADWLNPIPIHFLSIEPGCVFRLFVNFRTPRDGYPSRSFDRDFKQLRSLLKLAFDDLGAGGKTSSGYGYLAHESTNARDGESSGPPPLDVTLRGTNSKLTAYHKKKEKATTARRLLPQTCPTTTLSRRQKELLRRGELRARVLIECRRIAKVVEIVSPA